jgi:prepilin-type N-terminal cleavage/methylation domain-containing protein
MKKRNLKTKGLSLIELLVAITIFAIITLGMDSVFIANAKVNKMNKDVTISTNAGQKIIEEIRSNASLKPEYYLSLDDGKTLANLSKPPFSINSLGKDYSNKFVGEIEVNSGNARLTKDTNNSGGSLHIDKSPVKIGIEVGKPVTIVNLATKEVQSVFVKAIDDANSQFNLDTSNPSSGKGNLKISFPEGSLVIAHNKIINLRIYYADNTNKDMIDSRKNKPIITFSTAIAAPINQ